MAPPKARIPQRLLAGDLFGLNWNKATWKAPYQNHYPITISGGQAARLWSSFVAFGHFANRATYVQLRNLILGIPTFYACLILFTQCNWYQFFAMHCIPLGLPIPPWTITEYQEWKLWASWYKPGQQMKHHYSGQVSIPGSERLIRN